jgi:Na+/proline symporter
MHAFDWIVLSGYFLVMVGIGWWSRRRVHNAADFFTAGGKMPWWLAGISHHMSGYSAAVFVGYAALAYTTGFAVYVWWAVSITGAAVAPTAPAPGHHLAAGVSHHPLQPSGPAGSGLVGNCFEGL